MRLFGSSRINRVLHVVSGVHPTGHATCAYSVRCCQQCENHVVPFDGWRRDGFEQAFGRNDRLDQKPLVEM